MVTAERSFRAMGSDCHILVVTDSASSGDPTAIAVELADLAVERVALLEQCWSRFRASSELRRLNSMAGLGPIRVSADLFALVAHMAEAWRMTAGRFDPTVLQSMLRLGYDVDFHALVDAPGPADVDVARAPGMSEVTLDAEAGTIALPGRVGIDPGAIGKGLAADLIADEVMATGAAAGVLVNLGGDLTFDGYTEDGQPWVIGVEDARLPADHPDRVIRLLSFPCRSAPTGIATSTTMKRRWAQGRRHHIIDPQTGSMTTSDVVQVTVVAAMAWRAEVAATAAMVLPSEDAAEWLHGQARIALILTDDAAAFIEGEALVRG